MPADDTTVPFKVADLTEAEFGPRRSFWPSTKCPA